MEVSKMQTNQVQAMPEIKRIEATRAEQKRMQQAQEPQNTEQVAQAKRQPVVNTQGQTTGRLLNVTA